MGIGRLALAASFIVGIIFCLAVLATIKKLDSGRRDKQTPMLFSWGLNGESTPNRGVGEFSARSMALPAPELGPFKDSVLKCFHPDEGSMRHLICLAVGFGGHWLYVDQRGRGRFDGTEGAFNVVAWESMIRREPSLRNILRSHMVRLEIRNRSRSKVRLVDGCGFTRATVGPMATTTALTWFSRHAVMVDGRKTAYLTADMEYVEHISQVSRLTFTIKKNGIAEPAQGEHGPGGTTKSILAISPVQKR